MDWAGIAAIIVAIGGMTVGIMAELRKGRTAKADPDVPGSGAAVCDRLDNLTEALLDQGDEQREFNARVALHLGMLPLNPAPVRKAEADGNGGGHRGPGGAR